MKKKYIAPETVSVEFKAADVLTVSVEGNEYLVNGEELFS